MNLAWGHPGTLSCILLGSEIFRAWPRVTEGADPRLSGVSWCCPQGSASLTQAASLTSQTPLPCVLLAFLLRSVLSVQGVTETSSHSGAAPGNQRTWGELLPLPRIISSRWYLSKGTMTARWPKGEHHSQHPRAVLFCAAHRCPIRPAKPISGPPPRLNIRSHDFSV